MERLLWNKRQAFSADLPPEQATFQKGEKCAAQWMKSSPRSKHNAHLDKTDNGARRLALATVQTALPPLDRHTGAKTAFVHEPTGDQMRRLFVLILLSAIVV